MTKIHMTPNWSEVKPEGFYVYLHRRATDGSVFYVGKGKTRRAWDKNRSEYWERISSKHGVIIEICQDGLTEDNAFLLEEWLISDIGRKRGLCNISTGGSGKSGIKNGKYQREKSSQANRKEVINSDGIIFKSTVDAARYVQEKTGKKAVRSNIYQAACGILGSAYGKIWSFDTTKIPTGITSVRSRALTKGYRVECVEDNICFLTISGAVEWLQTLGHDKAKHTPIVECAKGIRKSAYGRTWIILSTPSERASATNTS